MPTFAPFLDDPSLRQLDEEEEANRPRKWRMGSYNVEPTLPSPPDIPETPPQDDPAMRQMMTQPTPQPYVDAPPDIPQPEPQDVMPDYLNTLPDHPLIASAKKHGLTIGMPGQKSQPKPKPQADLLASAKNHGLEIGKPIDPDAAQLPPGMKPRIYPGLQGPPDPEPKDPNHALDIGMFAGKGVEPIDIHPRQIWKGMKQNIPQILTAIGDTASGNPEYGGQINTVPTDEQVKRIAKGDVPAIPLTAGTKPGTVTHGVLNVLEGLTTPTNIALTAATMGSAGVEATGVKAIHKLLGGYFAINMGAHATQNVKDAYGAYMNGDLATVREKLGEGTMNAIFAGLGAYPIAKGVYDKVGPEGLAAHNAEADRLFNEQLKTDQTAQAARRTASGVYRDPIAVKVRAGQPDANGVVPFVDATVQFSDVAISGPAVGKPAMNVVDANGKTIFSGFPNQVKEWLADREARPGELPETPEGEGEPQPETPRRQGSLMQRFGQDVEPEPAAPETPLTPEDLMLLERNPDAIKDPRKRDELISRQTEVANRLQLWDNARAAGIDPFKGLEQEAGESPTKGAGSQPTTTTEGLFGPNPDGSYTVRNTATGETLFNGPAEAAHAFVRERTGANINTSVTAADAGVTPGSRPAYGLDRQPDGTYKVRTRNGQELFHGSIQDADAFVAQRTAADQAATPQAAPAAPAEKAPAAQTEAPEPLTQPAPPSKVEKVSPETPNPPTAAIPTTPEAPETMQVQLDQLGEGRRKVVMFPQGTPVPSQVPEGTGITNDGLGNIYVYRKDLTSESEIKSAAQNNKLNELLGDRQFGMGAPDKSAIAGEPMVVVVRTANGVEVQSTATDEANLQTTLIAADRLKPEGGTVHVEKAGQVLADRGAPQGTTPVAAPPTPVESLESPGDMEAPEVTTPSPSLTPSPEQPQQRGYQEIQDHIDRMESELEKRGLDVSKLYEPSEYNDKVFAGSDWKPMPPELHQLYRERDAAQEQEDTALDTGINERLKAVIPNDEQRAKLLQTITETDKPYAIRSGTENTPEDLAHNIGRVANAILKHVVEHVTKEPEDKWEQVTARAVGSDIQLVRESGPQGFEPYSKEAYAEAQKILDALMEGNAPKYPGRPEPTAKAETKPVRRVEKKAPKQIKQAEPEELAAPSDMEAPEEQPAGTVEEQAVRAAVETAAKGDADSKPYPPTQVEDARVIHRQQVTDDHAVLVVAGKTPEGQPVVAYVAERDGKVVTTGDYGPDWHVGSDNIRKDAQGRGLWKWLPQVLKPVLSKPAPAAETETPVAETKQAEPETLAGPEDPETPAVHNAMSQVADEVYAHIRKGEAIGNITKLIEMAERITGSSRTSGDWSIKDIYDAMEAGMNRYIVDHGAARVEQALYTSPTAEAPFPGLPAVRKLLELLTTQGVRTDEQIKFQQFSTPPTQAFLAAVIGHVTSSDVVVEPSAGTGGLAAWAKAVGAEVHVNEVAPRRVEMLKIAGLGDATSHDGEIIHSLLDTKVKPTLILMNPPFSAGGLKGKNAKNSNNFGFNHVNSALQRLAPNGRLVAILGGGQANQPDGGASLTTGNSAAWFKRLADKYNVRANVRISGKEYQKYGTNFATRLIVIDKTGPSDLANVVQGNVDTLEQAYELLRPVGESRPQISEGQARPGGEASTGTGQSGPSVASDPNASRQGSGERTQESDQAPGERPVPSGPVGTPSSDGRGQAGVGDQSAPRIEPDVEPAGAGQASAPGSPERPGGNADDQRPGESPVKRLELETTDPDEAPEEESSEAYVTYRPTLKGAPHPGDIVETKTMSTVPLPPITYKPALPQKMIDEGGISGVQLEGIALVGQQNEIILPSGARSSALIGDGTGVGKGRESAGILYDNFLQGRKRLIWVSEKWDLQQAAIADFEGMGATELTRGFIKQNGKYVRDKKAKGAPALTGQNKFKPDQKIKHEGVLFTTYSTLRSADKKGNSRAQQLEEWLRGDDNGDGAYILFDESHNLKNLVPAQGNPSRTALAANELLERLPLLRTASLSATAATEVQNLGYLSRLGLWGPGTAFPQGFRQFQEEVASGGLAAMELVARELKAQGKYISRTLSYKGIVYSEPEHKLNADQKEIYRTAAKAWKTVIQRAEQTIRDTTNGGSVARRNMMSQLGGAQQRFFNLLITTLKIPTAVQLANQALKDGKSVVLTLVNTNEAAQNRVKNQVRDEDEEEDQEFDFGPKEALIQFIKDHYPVQQWEDAVDDRGQPFKRPAFRENADGTRTAILNPQAEAERDELIAQINRDLHLPKNPLDILIDSLGGRNKVAELTGRKEVFDEEKQDFVPRGDPNVPKSQYNLIEMQKFQNDEKRVAVLSSAAGTGISLHASNRAKNQRQRYHITLQVGWSADKQMQMFGRTHRTDQKQPPEYVMLTSDLGGEKRFISTITRRLGSLGALTKGQKNATGGGALMDKVNFESVQGRAAAMSFYAALLANDPVPGTGMIGHEVLEDLRMMVGDAERGQRTVPLEDRDNVTRLLNRMLALDPDIQNAVYNYYYDIFEGAIRQAQEDGTLDTGVRTLPGDSFHFHPARTIATDKKTGAKTQYQQVDAEVRQHKLTVADLKKRIESHKDDDPTIRLNPKTQALAFTIRAAPRVSANGQQTPSVYISAPGQGRTRKVDLDSLSSWTPIDRYAKEKKQALDSQLTAAKREAKYYTDEMDRQTRSEREKRQSVANATIQRLENIIKNNPLPSEVARFQSQLPEAQKQLKEAQNYEVPADNWRQEQLKSAQEHLARVEAEVEANKPLTDDTEKWTLDRWQELYDAAPTHITEEHHFITGAVLGYWNPIREAAQLRNSIFTATDTKTGKRLVGIDIPDGNIGRLLQRIEGGESTVNAAQLETDVLRNGLTYTLETGIQVLRGRINRNPVIQMIPPSENAGRTLTDLGLKYERGVTPIFYVPSSGSRDIITRVLEQFPVQAEREHVNVNTSIQPPTLSGDRDEPYERGRNNRYHLGRARIERFEIEDAEDAANAVGVVANPHAFEFFNRTNTKDFVPDHAGLRRAGFALDPQEVGSVLRNLELTEQEYGHLPPSLVTLREAAEEAQRDGKALVWVKDGVALTEEKRAQVEREELNHAMQARLAPGDSFLGNRARTLVDSELGKRAVRYMRSRGYPQFRNRGHAAIEVGERLMREGAYTELGLSKDEGDQLAQQYVTLLEQAYGSKADPITRRVQQAYKVNRTEAELRDGEAESRDRRPEQRVRERDDREGPTEADINVNENIVGQAVSQFTSQTVVPKAADAVRGTRETVDDLVHLLAPRFGTPTTTLDQIYKLKGGRDRALHLLGVKLKKWSKTVNKMGQAEHIAFIDNLKTGQPQATPDLQDLADFIRKVDDNLFSVIKKYNPSLSYLADHFRVLWKVVPGSPQAKSAAANMKDAFRGPSKRPLQGSKGFLRQHTLADMSDGIAMGGVPVTYNPIKMFMLHYSDAMKYITAQRLWRQFKKTGIRKYVRKGDRNIPPGYVRLDDSIARVWFPVKQGMVNAGEWYVEKHAARLLNNFLSRDLIREKAAGRALLAVKNFTTAMELSLSPFHAVFEASEAVSSQIAIAMRELWNLGVRQKNGKAAFRALRTLGTSPAAFATMARTGSMAKQAFENWPAFSASPEGQAWLKQYPTAQDDMRAFFDGGGQMGMSQDYKILAVNGFADAWNNARQGNPGSYINAGLTAIPSLNELIMKPLFEHYIPNLKMGFFLREYNLGKVEYSDRLASGEMTQLELARKTIDSVENRFGEMNFDNLFWNRTFKTTLQIMFRSVTWKLGNIRANAGAVGQLFKEGKRSAKTGDIPALPGSTAWFFGTVLFTMALGGTIYYLSTGKRPRTVKDFVYPPLGKNGPRISIPGYSRDLYHAEHDPKGYAKSGLTGVWENIVDVMQNKDFYGRETYSPDDPVYRQAWDAFWHVVPSPFSFASFFAAKQEGDTTAGRMAGFFGFTKAPRYVAQTDAENLATEFMGEDRREGARTRAAADTAGAKSRIRNIVRRGDSQAAEAEIRKDVDKGLIQRSDVPTLWRQGRDPKLLGMVKGLDMTQQLKVYEQALPEERAQIQKEVRHKVLVNRFKPNAWNPTAERLARKHFNMGQGGTKQAIPSPSALDSAMEMFR